MIYGFHLDAAKREERVWNPGKSERLGVRGANKRPVQEGKEGT